MMKMQMRKSVNVFYFLRSLCGFSFVLPSTYYFLIEICVCVCVLDKHCEGRMIATLLLFPVHKYSERGNKIETK